MGTAVNRNRPSSRLAMTPMNTAVPGVNPPSTRIASLAGSPPTAVGVIAAVMSVASTVS